VPGALQVPLIVLAALATIIASQAIITGAFSMTRQAIQLGWLPRLRIKQTAAESYGQIYIGAINWLLMVVTIGLVVFFESSDKLAAAYGIAVSLTMLMTTGLLFVAMREIWRWSLFSSAAIAMVFFVIDTSFLFANMIKVLEGGYIPLLLAAAICTVMLIWNRGIKAVAKAIGEKGISVDGFFSALAQKRCPEWRARPSF
jgi:KUP system potassium uptake protein